MRNENGTKRNMAKGYLFEAVIKQLLVENGFAAIDSHNNSKIREQRRHFIEFRGRGGWHQIDCPYDYVPFIPFVYPIRILGEVKFYAKQIEKRHIREFIGVIKDIQENYFVPDGDSGNLQRFTEVGVFFSANGFEDEAEKLAFAHNIKNVSYKNNWIIYPIKELIEVLERNYLQVNKCIAEDKTSLFISCINTLLKNEEERPTVAETYTIFREEFDPANGFERVIADIKNHIRNIKSSFVMNTSGGAFLHFLGHDEFPWELFDERDEQDTKVFIEQSRWGEHYYLTFSNDNQGRKYYFAPPLSLKQAVYYGSQDDLMNEKRRLFRTLHTTMRNDRITRNLTLKLDRDWLDE